MWTSRTGQEIADGKTPKAREQKLRGGGMHVVMLDSRLANGDLF